MFTAIKIFTCKVQRIAMLTSFRHQSKTNSIWVFRGDLGSRYIMFSKSAIISSIRISPYWSIWQISIKRRNKVPIQSNGRLIGNVVRKLCAKNLHFSPILALFWTKKTFFCPKIRKKLKIEIRTP